MKVLNSYSACETCYNYIANDFENLSDLSDEDKNLIRRTFKLVHAGDLFTTGKELGFSWCTCDFCDKHLAGNRYEVIGLA